MNRLMLILGPLLALPLGGGLYLNGSTSSIAWTAGITTLTACWWIFEPIPIPATSLIPIAMFPLVGVLQASEVGAAYGDKLILLLMGGFMLSAAMERSGAHRRIALTMVSLFGGTNGRRLVFGFMTASAMLSMWISNMATTLMLLPIALAVLEKVSEPRLRTALLLGIAYSASIGGVGTPIGTPPNLLFLDAYGKISQQQPAADEQPAAVEDPTEDISFARWMIWIVPIVAIMIPLSGFWLTRNLPPHDPIVVPPVGNWRTEEVRTLAVFAVTALLWITLKEPFGGWRTLLGFPGASNASVALVAVVAMFLIPNGKGERLLNWETAANIPWGILLLFSSGMVIAAAFKTSGLSEAIGSSLTGLGQIPVLLLIAAFCLSITFLTEVTSNTATAALLLPILGNVALSNDIDPKVIMIPATISASFAFMLPAATGPNAVVFGSGQLTIREMAREGFALNLIGVAVVTLICFWALT